MSVAGIIDRAWLCSPPPELDTIILDNGKTVSMLVSVVVGGHEKGSCSPRRRCNNFQCAKCYDNSHASAVIDILWADNRTVPRMISKFNHQRYWYYCHKCSHYFDVEPATASRRTGCPFCCRNPQRSCSFNDCVVCKSRNVFSLKCGKRWCWKKNLISSRIINQHDKRKFYFLCATKKCGHILLMTIKEAIASKTCDKCIANPPRMVKDPSYGRVNKYLHIREQLHVVDQRLIEHPLCNYFKPVSCSSLPIHSPIKASFTCPGCQGRSEQIIKDIVMGKECPLCHIPWMNIEMERFIRKFAIEYKKDWSLGDDRYSYSDHRYSYLLITKGFKIIVELDNAARLVDQEYFQCVQERALLHGYYVIRVSYNSDIYGFVKRVMTTLKERNRGNVIYSDAEHYKLLTLGDPAVLATPLEKYDKSQLAQLQQILVDI